MEILRQDLLYWQGLQSWRPVEELGYDDPSQGIMRAQQQLREVNFHLLPETKFLFHLFAYYHHSSFLLPDFLIFLRQAFTRITVSSINLTNKINELQRNSISRSELVQAQKSLNYANRLLEEVKADLESARSELNKTKARLEEVEVHLADANFLAEEFKKIDEYILMQNQIWNDGAKWALKRVGKHDPSFDPSTISGEISTMLTNRSAFPNSDGFFGGRDDMDVLLGDGDN